MLIEGFEEFHIAEECPDHEATRANMAKGSARLLAALHGEAPEPQCERRRRTTPGPFVPPVRFSPRANGKKLWPAWYRPPRAPAPSAVILAGVAQDFAISVSALTGKRKHERLIHGRAVVARLLRERGWSYPQIGRVIGGRDHTTIINLVDKFEIYARADPSVLYSYESRRLA